MTVWHWKRTVNTKLLWLCNKLKNNIYLKMKDGLESQHKKDRWTVNSFNRVVHLKKMLWLCNEWKKNSGGQWTLWRSGCLMNDSLDSQWKKRWTDDSGQWHPGRSGHWWMTLEMIVQWWMMMPCEGKDGKSCHETDAPVECECALDPKSDASAKECVGETCSPSEQPGESPKKMPVTVTEEDKNAMTAALII